MKKINRLFVALVAVIACVSCQNDGNIGKYFGSWRFDAYIVDGKEVTELKVGESTIVPLDHVTISFQNNVVNIVTDLDDYLNNYSQFGTWSDEGDTFILDFTHVDASNVDGISLYNAPAWLGMISDEPMKMTVSDSSSRAFTLTWIDPRSGVKRVYKLHKTW